MAAVGRDFRFPLDVDLAQIPSLNDDSNSALHSYLRDVSNDSEFAISILQCLIEERRQAHKDRANKDKEVSPFQVGDVVKAHVQVQSKADTGEVAKLSYRARGPFQITQDLGHNSFEVKRYNEPNSATRKYKATELYLLPLKLFPHEPLDTIDERYLNYDHAPLTSPLQKSLNIELYNEQSFNPRLPSFQPSKDTPATSIDKTAFLKHTAPAIPSINDLQSIAQTHPIPIEISPLPSQSPTNLQLFQQINLSKDKLFFINYTPANTMRKRWYIIQVDLPSTKELCTNYNNTGLYYCVFLARHPNDNKRSDEFSRWWPEWHEYTQHKTSNDIIYGKRILIRPNVTPNPNRYIQWATVLPLGNNDSSHTIYGPFDFNPINATNRTHNKISLQEWRLLNDHCNNNGLLPPTFGANITHLPTTTKSIKQRQAAPIKRKPAASPHTARKRKGQS